MNINEDMTISRREVVIGLVVAALALRMVFLALAGLNAPPTGDELAYQQLAENFAAGRGLFQTHNPFFPGQVLYAWQAPLYPVTLGVLYTLFGNSVLLAKLFGALVSTATVAVMYDLARRVGRSAFAKDANAGQVESIALVAAGLMAIYPGFLTNAHLLLSETLFIFLLLLAFDLVARALETSGTRVALWLGGAGVMWGLATLTRGLTLYFTPLLAAWLVWTVWRKHEGALRNGLGMAAVFVALTAVVIAPWTIRNYLQFGQVVVLETKGGVNLWLGNSPYTPYSSIRDVWKVGVREPMLSALPQGELAQDRAGYALALNYMRSEPLAVLARVPAKFADFWGFERNLVDIAEATTRGTGWNSLSKIGSDVLAMVVYAVVMVCGVAGLVFAPNDWHDPHAPSWKILFGGFTIYFLLLHLVIFGDGRFHLPLIPIFALYAGWMLVKVRQAQYALPRVGLTVALTLLLASVWVRELWAAVQVLQR